ncbi:MAG: GspE/PulE family protein [Sedimentibacter sp.]
MNKNIPLGQLLISNGYISEKQLERALEVQKKVPDKRLGDILIELDYVTEKNMLECLSSKVNSPFINLKNYKINQKAVKLVSETFARAHKIIPIDFDDNVLIIATSDPLNFYIFDEINVMTGHEVKTVLSVKEDIFKAIDTNYSDSVVQRAVENINKTFETDDLDKDLILAGDNIEGTPTVKIVSTLISQAALKGASDIHIEPSKHDLNVRIRVDGDLLHHATMRIAAHNSIVTRIKILSGLNIAEKRIPQDGGFHFESGNINVDLRVSILPTIYGEKVVLRLLNNANVAPLNIKQVGLNESDLGHIKEILKTPNGIILVTGPTGSGKTTTLYALINELIHKNNNIITVEDPVERPIDGVSQVQVNNKAGLTFANALRSILRQDPDIIMIGEIRDNETAEIAIRSSITGHLVLGSIHTNDSIATIARLIDMGIEPYLVGASLSGIIAQRLVKLLCPHCKEKYELSVKEKLLLNSKTDYLYRPVGCDKCNYSGYSGRKGIYEIVKVDGNLREMIAKGSTIHEMQEYQRKKQTKFLKDSIMELTINGETSISELEKIVYSVD